MTDQPAGPPELLDVVCCSCKKDCSTKRCTCKKHGLPCTAICRECRGTSCTNSPLPDLMMTMIQSRRRMHSKNWNRRCENKEPYKRGWGSCDWKKIKKTKQNTVTVVRDLKKKKNKKKKNKNTKNPSPVVANLSWWGGLCASLTLRTIPVGVIPPAGTAKTGRLQVRGQSKSNIAINGSIVGWRFYGFVHFSYIWMAFKSQCFD